MDEIAAVGAKAANQAEIGESCDVVLTMLPNSPQVKEVMLGEDGVAAHMRPGTVFIDMSSINPVASKEIAAVLEAKDIDMLDAPVSGGEPKAVDGTLSFMVGGKQEVFDKYKDILAAMGASVVRCGDVGAGNTTKLANQIIVACNIQAVAEALTLAQKAGVNPQLVFEAIWESWSRTMNFLTLSTPRTPISSSAFRSTAPTPTPPTKTAARTRATGARATRQSTMSTC